MIVITINACRRHHYRHCEKFNLRHNLIFMERSGTLPLRGRAAMRTVGKKIMKDVDHSENDNQWLVTPEGNNTENAEEDNCDFPTYFELSNLQVGCGVNNGSRGEHHQGVSGSQGGAGYASKGAKRGFP